MSKSSSCLVFSVGDVSSWEALERLRMMMLTSTKEGKEDRVLKLRLKDRK